MFDIPPDKYNNKLREILYSLLFSKDDSEKKSAALLMQILKMGVPQSNNKGEDIANVQLTEEEQKAIISNGWLESENIEVKCRCNDLMLKSFKGDRRRKALEICNEYLQAYEVVEYGTRYLLRSMQIANCFHLSDADYINNVCKFIRKVPSAWLKDIAKEAKTLLPENKKQHFINILLKAKDDIDYPKNHADNERDCLDALYILGYYDKDKYIYETALSYERTADYFDNLHKEDPHTYQHGAFMYMDKAYKTIVKAKKQYRQAYLRLQKKLVKQQLIENEAISILGAKIHFKISEQTISFVSHKLIGKDSLSVIRWLLDFPFLNDSSTRVKEKKAEEELCFLYRNHSKSLYHNEEGNTIGTSNGSETVGEVHYRNFRFNVRFIVNYALSYIYIMDEPKFISRFTKLIEINKPSFVENEKLHLWQRGLLAGLNADWDLLVFILVPLVESALHNIAEERTGEDLTELEKEIQKEPALGKDLRMLTGHIDDGVLRELSLFLEKGSGENLRNKVAHGLITESNIQLWGPYMWWIAMKIYFKKI